MRYGWRALSLAAMLVSGCGTWFGESEGPPLEGKRVSVLEHQTTLAADPQAAVEPIVLPPATLNADWPQAGGGGSHAMHNPQAGNLSRPAWTASIGAGIASDRPEMPSPVVGGGRVFTMDTENVVSAFDARTGKSVWSVDLTRKEDDDDAKPGGIAYDNGRIFATTGFAKVVALDAGSGKEIWRRSVGLPVHVAPTVAGGRVFVITIENQLRALNASDGTQSWPPYQALAELARLQGGASPAAEGGIVVAPFSSGELVVIRAETGRPLWTESLAPLRRTDEISSLAQIKARPLINQGQVYAISVGGILAAFDVRSGQRLWDRDIGGLQSPWIAGQQLFQITNENALICIASDTGRVHWITELPKFKDEKKHEEPILWSGPVLAGSRLLAVGSDGRLLTISPYDGRIVDRQTVAAGISVPPVVADGTVYLLDDDGNLAAYR